MPIEFACEHCGKHIRTPDENAGKRGKCPQCHQSIYVPTPSDDIELLKLAPVDPQEQIEKRKADEEARRVIERIRSERAAPPESPGRAARGGAAAREGSRPHPPEHAAPEPHSDSRLRADMERLLIDYAGKMAAGQLTEAQVVAEEVRGSMELAEEVIQQITMDELPPPALAKIPRPVLIGFFKQLREG